MSRNKLNLIGVVVGMLLTPMGCVEDDEQDLEEKVQSLRIDGADPAEGLFGSYEKDGDVIYFEAVRGIPITDENEDGNPKYEVDIRFIDRDGYIFISQNGGSVPIDDGWVSDQEITDRAQIDGSIDLGGRKNAFLLVKEVGIALANLRDTEADSLLSVLPFGISKEQIKPELDAIIGCALFEDSIPMQSAVSSESSPSRASTYKHGFAAYKQPRAGGWEHSCTTQILHYPSGTWAKKYNCNHGDCPYDGLQQYCSKTYYNRDGNIKWGNNCTTKFGLDHVCHDDTYLQVIDIRDNIYHGTTGGRCNDRIPRTTAPAFSSCDPVPPIPPCSTTQCATAQCCSGLICCEGRCRGGTYCP